VQSECRKFYPSPIFFRKGGVKRNLNIVSDFQENRPKHTHINTVLAMLRLTETTGNASVQKYWYNHGKRHLINMVSST